MKPSTSPSYMALVKFGSVCVSYDHLIPPPPPPPPHSGFDLLLSQLDDLSLDTPDAPEILGNFMARCVADDCLPPAYVTNHSESTDTNIM